MQGTIEGNAAPDVDEEGGRQDTAGTARRRRRFEHGVIAALVVVVLVAIAVLGFRSGTEQEQDPVEPTAEALPVDEGPATTAAPTTAPTAEDPPAEDPATPAPAEPAHTHDEAAAVLADGRHPVFLTGLDTAGRTLELDVIQWLTGDDATGYVETHPDEYPGLYEEIEQGGSYPYDSLVVNENPRLRTLPVAENPQILVLLTENSTNWPHTVGFDELPTYFDAHDDWIETEGRISNSVFWLTVDDGEIVGLEEQFQS